MRISVIIPVFNVENYIEQCLDSILNQTHNDLEIILVNDGSTDRSSEICERYVRHDKRIRLVNQENAGVSVARNLGLQHATGIYVTFVDSDDWLHPQMYHLLYEKIQQRENVDVVMCDYEHVWTNGRTKISRNIRAGLFNKEQIIQEFYPQLLVTEDFGGIPVLSACTLLVKRDILLNNNVWFDPLLRFGEDYLFTPQYMIHINSFYYLKNQYLYYYRQIPNSRSKQYNTAWWSNFVYLNEQLRKLLESQKFDFTRQLKLQLVHSALIVLARIMEDSTMTKDEKIREVRKLMSEPELRKSLRGLEIRTQHPGLRLVIFLIRQRLAVLYTYFLNYRK